MTTKLTSTLLIGIGGTGRHALNAIKRDLCARYAHPHHPLPCVRLLAIDTELNTDNAPVRVHSRYLAKDLAADSTYPVKLTTDECFPITVQKGELKEAMANPEIWGAEDFVAADKLAPVIDSIEGQGAGGFAITGKMALWPHLKMLKERLATELAILNSPDSLAKKLSFYDGDYALEVVHRINVYILCSMGGGTGRGTALSVAALARELLNDLGPRLSENAQLLLFNYGPSCFQLEGRKVDSGYLKTIQRNHAAGMIELEHVLRHGYPLERKLCELLARDYASRADQIFTEVIQVGAQLSGNEAFVGDFHTLNDTVAGVVTDLLFGNMNNDLQAYLRSNKGSFILNNPIDEAHGFPAERSRSYGRIGRQKLMLPLDRMLRYAERFHTERQVVRTLTGVVPFVKKEHDRLVSTLVKDLEGITQQLIGNYRIPTYGQLQEQLNQLSDPIVQNLLLLVKGPAESLDSHIATRARGQNQVVADARQRLRTLFERVDKEQPGKNQDLERYAEQYGLRALLRVLEELRQRTEVLTYEIFETVCQQLGLEATDAEWSQRLGAYLYELQEKHKHAYDPFVRGETAEFKELQQTLEADKAAWERANSGWWAQLRGPQPKHLRTARAPFEQLVRSAQAAFSRYREAVGHYARWQAFVRIGVYLDARIEILRANIHQLDDTHEDGLLYQLRTDMRHLLRERDQGLAVSVIERGPTAYGRFAESLCAADGVALTDRFAEQLQTYRARLSREACSSEALRTGLAEVTTAVHERRERHSLTSYLEAAERRGEGERLRELLENILRRANMLGGLVGTGVRGGLGSGGFSIAAIRAHRPMWWKEMYPALTAGISFSESVDPLELTITRIETGLPLFVFREFPPAYEEYQKGMTPQNVYSLHTHRDFVELAPPAGLPYELEPVATKLLYHLLLHLDLVQVRQDMVYQRRWNSDERAVYTAWEDERLDPYRYPLEQRYVPVDRWLAELSKRPKWLNRVIALLGEGLERLLDQQASEVLHYLTDHGRAYPCLPPLLLAHLTEALPDTRLAQLLDRYAVANRYYYQAQQATTHLQAQAALPTQRAELAEWYDLPAPPEPGHKAARYRAVTTHDKKPTGRLSLEEVVQLIRRNPNVLVSKRKKPRSKDWQNWRRFPELVAAVGRSKRA